MSMWQRALYLPNLPLGEDGNRVTASKEHISLSREAAKEGMVLLKNDNHILPLAFGSKIALFGKGTFDYVKGGGGSGDVMVAYTTNLYDGLTKLSDKVHIFEELAGFYKDNVNQQYQQGIQPGMTTEPLLPEELCKKARDFTDTAIITISRFSGEGWDRISKYDPPKESANHTNADIFEDGDFYLTHAEKAMIDCVRTYFSKIVVVMNVGGMVDTCWLKNDPLIKGVLMAWQGGIEGGMAAAEILCGITNPSGKLADTFAKALEDYPSTKNFHESKDYVEYKEDIYVGYRYFETVPEAYEKVNYEFGFGLSYTSFEYTVKSVQEKEGLIQVAVMVKNTGTISGKEVLQLYVNPPQGVLGKPKKNLVTFQKTKLLAPMEEQLLELKFQVKDLGSFDDLGKIQKSAYLLEKGDYEFFLGTSVRNVMKLDYVYQLCDNVVLQQLSSLIAPTQLSCRMLADGTFETLPLGKPNDPNETELSKENWREKDGMIPTVRYVEGINRHKTRYKNDAHPLSDVACGKITLEQFMDQLSDEELAHLLGGQPNTGVSNTFGFGNMLEYGVPNVMTADGPAGLRVVPECGVKTTAFPCATAIACSWNPEIAYQVGKAGAKEVKENNIGVWLTPAVNIHRSPLCGRNFEYYSEDPLLTGKMASSMVKGIQSEHIAATVKHFALNNKETNRKNSDSRVSERAAREIYLKAFQIIVEQADPWCIMTSYNIINGHRASENQDLLWGILRGEWHYDGLVMTDWWTHGDHYKEVKAGNDAKMACGFPERLMEARKKGIISREDLIYCAKHVLKMILKIGDESVLPMVY